MLHAHRCSYQRAPTHTLRRQTLALGASALFSVCLFAVCSLRSLSLSLSRWLVLLMDVCKCSGGSKVCVLTLIGGAAERGIGGVANAQLQRMLFRAVPVDDVTLLPPAGIDFFLSLTHLHTRSRAC